MKKNDGIAKWQQDFFMAPAVWVVEDDLGYLDSIYESKEAAVVALRFLNHGRKYKAYRSRKINIHSMDLAARRWGNFS